MPISEADERPDDATADDAAPVQASKADELLRQVGLRRAAAEKTDMAAERPEEAPQGKGRTPFAWSKPGTSSQPVAESASKQQDDSEEADEAVGNGSRTQLPPPRGRRPGGPAVAPPALAPQTDPVAERVLPETSEEAETLEAPAESPFTPKGFVNKKPQPTAQPRRGLPVKPTPLRLSKRPAAPVAPVAPVEEVVEQQQPSDEGEPEQQNFDSTLEPQQKGRFDKGEPTVENGEDLDLPTFLRRKKG